MDATTQHLAFWSWALVNMVFAVATAFAAVARIRRRDVRAHRRRMLSAAALVGLFVLAYLGKVAWLGREDLSRWSPSARALLWFHEACVAAFVLAGAFAFALAWRNRFRAAGAPAPAALERAARWHRRAGWTALVASSLGVVSATGVLWGMLARAG